MAGNVRVLKRVPPPALLEGERVVVNSLICELVEVEGMVVAPGLIVNRALVDDIISRGWNVSTTLGIALNQRPLSYRQARTLASKLRKLGNWEGDMATSGDLKRAGINVERVRQLRDKAEKE